MILSEIIEKKASVVRLNGKIPAEKGWQKWSELPRPRSEINGGNYGIVCGPASGLIVLDIDDAEKFKEAGLETPTTALVKTSKGYHLYFKYPDTGKKYGNASDQERGFDIKGYGGQVVGPGSIHPETKIKYEIVRDIEPADIPEWMYAVLTPQAILQAQNRTQHENMTSGMGNQKKSSKRHVEGCKDDRKPLDRYNQGTHPMDLLSGWQYTGTHGVYNDMITDLVVRPGKKISAGCSGSIVHTGDPTCPLKFYNFSSNSGFDVDRMYSPADLYAALNHGGDINAAAKALHEIYNPVAHVADVAIVAHVADDTLAAIDTIDAIVAQAQKTHDTLCQNALGHTRIYIKGCDPYDAAQVEKIKNSLFSDMQLNSLQNDVLTDLVAIVARVARCRAPVARLSRALKSRPQSDGKAWQDISNNVNEYINQSVGQFSANDIYREFEIKDKKTKACVRGHLSRLKKNGTIEPVGIQNGTYRLVNTDSPEIDFLNADSKNCDVWLPFGMNRLVETMPGNIIVFAGEQNAGKTALMLNMVRGNQDNFRVHYFSSEMGPSEFNKRLRKFDGCALDSWRFRAYERASNFADVIVPGEGNLNIIDYFEIHDAFYLVAEQLGKIHDKLNGAIAVIAIQKERGTDRGRGGSFSLEKPRLYCAVSPNKLKIVKGKNWASDINPNGLVTDFKLWGGCNLVKDGSWYREKDRGIKEYIDI